jgi:hypothetical protein
MYFRAVAGSGITSIESGGATCSQESHRHLLQVLIQIFSLTITASGNTQTFNPNWIGTLASGRGGTGISAPTAAGLLTWKLCRWVISAISYFITRLNHHPIFAK